LEGYPKTLETWTILQKIYIYIYILTQTETKAERNIYFTRELKLLVLDRWLSSSCPLAYLVPSMDVGGRSLLVADIISDAVSRDLSFLRAPLPVDVGDSLLAIPLAKVFSTEDTLAWEHWMLYN